AQGLIDKDATLTTKPDDVALKKKVDRELAEKIRAQQSVYEEDLSEEDVYDYYDCDEIYSDDALTEHPVKL
ncbi:MAG: hypothetical protein K2N32_04810, partial [Clostridia bacterium]|nr:hypothetical protein [Clostridia bacterium]